MIVAQFCTFYNTNIWIQSNAYWQRWLHGKCDGKDRVHTLLLLYLAVEMLDINVHVV